MIWFLSFHHSLKVQLTSAISLEDVAHFLIVFCTSCMQGKQASWQQHERVSELLESWSKATFPVSKKTNRGLTFRFMRLHRVKIPAIVKKTESWWHHWLSPGVHRPHAKVRHHLRGRNANYRVCKGLRKLLEATGLISFSLTSLTFLDAGMMHDFLLLLLPFF